MGGPAPEAMTAAVQKLDRTLDELVGVHGGVRPVEQGEGDSFVVAFAQRVRRGGMRGGTATCTAGSDSVAHRAAHRRGAVARRGQLHRLDDQSDRRLRDLAHGGQTVLSGTTGRYRDGSASAECVVSRPRQPRRARSAPAGTRHAAVSPGSAQRVPAAPDGGCRCVAESSGSADEFRGARSTTGRGAWSAVRRPARHA